MSLEDGDPVEETLKQLRDEAPNQQVEDLLDVVQHMHTRINRLESMADPDFDKPLSYEFDAYDEPVMHALSESDPDTVTMDEFKTLYRRHTDIKNDETIRSRVKSLVKIGPFENERPGRWRFLGFPD